MRSRYESGATAEEIKEKMGEQFIRMWELYLVASEMAFVYGRFVNYQVLFSKSRFSAPITREYMVSTYA
jgi:cyclopropane-fatty-acyl-phospholipid synthase